MPIVRWTFSELEKMERRWSVLFYEAGTMVAGGAAGTLARALVVPIAESSVQNNLQSIAVKGPQMALFFWIYVSFSSKVTRDIHDPPQKMFSTFFLASMSGWIMRACTNPLNRICYEAKRLGGNPTRHMISRGILNLWFVGHPLLANSIYFGTMMVCVEGTRRFIERQGAVCKNRNVSIGVNAFAGGFGTFVASSLTWGYSRKRYNYCVIHNSVLLKSYRATIMKEVPLMAATFGIFTFLQHKLSRHHGPRGGLGY